jgi:hypothetical protein
VRPALKVDVDSIGDPTVQVSCCGQDVSDSMCSLVVPPRSPYLTGHDRFRPRNDASGSKRLVVEDVFNRFRRHAAEYFVSRDSAEAFLAEMWRDAETFREFAQMDAGTSRGRFYKRVVEALEMGATIPLLLWLISDNHAVPANQVDVALDALESWVVRRTLLRNTMKDVNRLIIAMLRDLAKQPVAPAGHAVVAFLGQRERRDGPLLLDVGGHR